MYKCYVETTSSFCLHKPNYFKSTEMMRVNLAYYYSYTSTSLPPDSKQRNWKRDNLPKHQHLIYFEQHHMLKHLLNLGYS